MAAVDGRRVVRVRVPASAANLGPGFDCLGMALGLYHRLTVTEEPGTGMEVSVRGEGAGQVPLGGANLVAQALQQALDQSGHRPGRLRLSCSNEIPLACGLGSSAAAVVAGLAAGLLLAGRLDRHRLIEMAVAAEGHPDNAVPCVLGGITAAVHAAGGVHWVRLAPPSGLRAVVAVPDFHLPTQEARAVLPGEVTFADAVANVGRTGLLVAALAAGRLEVLQTAMEDRLHEPYRAQLVPGLAQVRQAALEAGALGTALSGAGPAVLALVQGEAGGVGPAMEQAWSSRGVRARSLPLEVDTAGLVGECVHEET
ncbi:MAG: homoserine kinase [Candidatus Latescibacterota bacterium]